MLATLRPYMEIMNKWLTEGKLEDPQSEFLVKKYNHVHTTHTCTVYLFCIMYTCIY